MKPTIQNPNSSGQGFHESGPSHPFAAIVTRFGYAYSHSTPVGRADGGWNIYHSFRHPAPGEHYVSLMSLADGTPRDLWETSVSPATGRRVAGKGEPELKEHLASKARRYGLTRAPKPTKPQAFPPAYFDSFAGWLPCKVLRVADSASDTEWAGCSSSCQLTVELTANRGAYKRGELVESDALKIVPRSHVRGNRITGGYRWNADPAKCVAKLFTPAAGLPATV